VFATENLVVCVGALLPIIGPALPKPDPLRD